MASGLDEDLQRYLLEVMREAHPARVGFYDKTSGPQFPTVGDLDPQSLASNLSLLEDENLISASWENGSGLSMPLSGKVTAKGLEYLARRTEAQ